jgi:apolipoprotein N-acyltransferase
MHKLTESLQTLWKEGFALIAGGFLALAFAPLAFYPLAVICPALLLYLWLSCTPARAFRVGLCFGIGFFSVGVSWVFISIHVFGHSAIFLALLITALFIFILALFPALQGYLLNRFFPDNNRIKCYLIFPSLWTLGEWVRSWVFTGFPWLLLGTSQVNSPLVGYAPLLGIFGVTFLLALSSALFLDLIRNRKHFLLPLLMLIALWTIGYSLTWIHWTRIVGKPIQVSLVQANIPQEIKWQAESLQTSLMSYLQLTQSHWHSQLVIWPEAAIPLLQHQALPFLDQLDKKAKQYGTTLITGIPIKKGFQYYNGMIALGVDHATYYKQRLVIFGEYLPWWISWAQGLLTVLDIPMSDFSPGLAKQTAFQVAGFDLGTFICYEIAYPGLVRQALPQAQMLLTINDDAWFGHSFALAQHLQIGQFQALATGRYLLFLSNTGMTAIVTPQGKIQAQLPPFQTGVLSATVYKTLGSTPWIRLGDCPSILFLVGLIVLCYAYAKKHINEE